MSNPIYQMCINNTAYFLRNIKEEDRQTEGNFTAFQAARVLSIAFAKREDDIINDILAYSGRRIWSKE